MVEVGVYTIYVCNDNEKEKGKFTTEVHEVASYVDNRKYPAPMDAPVEEVEWSTSTELRLWIEESGMHCAPRS